MNFSILPAPHPDSYIDALRPMVTSTVVALVEHGIRVHASWLDPRDPRDTTILYSLDGNGSGTSGPFAAVWDEETGWRAGTFVSGRQGVRTTLAEVRFLGGGLLPGGDEVARRILSCADVPAKTCRHYTDLTDGFEESLRAHGAVALARA